MVNKAAESDGWFAKFKVRGESRPRIWDGYMMMDGGVINELIN